MAEDEPFPGWRTALVSAAEHAAGLTRKWPLEEGAYITPDELRRLATNPGSVLRDRVRRALFIDDPDPAAVRRHALATLTDAERLALFREYCLNCGCPNPRCPCANDE